jgi:hypothetical protein
MKILKSIVASIPGEEPAAAKSYKQHSSDVKLTQACRQDACVKSSRYFRVSNQTDPNKEVAIANPILW